MSTAKSKCIGEDISRRLIETLKPNETEKLAVDRLLAQHLTEFKPLCAPLTNESEFYTSETNQMLRDLFQLENSELPLKSCAS